MGNKEIILRKIKNTYCRLQPSKISGVGVFAVREIPKGINPFHGAGKPKWLTFNIAEFKHIDPEILKMIDDFNVIEKDGTVLIPDCAMNGMDISFFVNNSCSPNLSHKDAEFTTLRKIKKGEELFADYGTYDHKYKK